MYINSVLCFVKRMLSSRYSKRVSTQRILGLLLECHSLFVCCFIVSGHKGHRGERGETGRVGEPGADGPRGPSGSCKHPQPLYTYSRLVIHPRHMSSSLSALCDIEYIV